MPFILWGQLELGAAREGQRGPPEKTWGRLGRQGLSGGMGIARVARAMPNPDTDFVDYFK